jgi:hypothetical protein
VETCNGGTILSTSLSQIYGAGARAALEACESENLHITSFCFAGQPCHLHGTLRSFAEGESPVTRLGARHTLPIQRTAHAVPLLNSGHMKAGRPFGQRIYSSHAVEAKPPWPRRLSQRLLAEQPRPGRLTALRIAPPRLVPRLTHPAAFFAVGRWSATCPGSRLRSIG